MSSDSSSLSGRCTAAGASNGTGAVAMDNNSARNGPWAQLWDKTTTVSAHTAKGIDFLERFGQFIKERAQIEEEYAAKLKSLAKKSRGKKADDEEFKMFTTLSAFQSMLGEMESFASQHEVIGERLRGELLPQLSEKCRQLRSTRKKHAQDFDAMDKGFQSKVDEMFKQKKNYEKAYADAQNAHFKFIKVDENRHMSRYHVDKAKQEANTKSAACEQGKQNYAAQLAITNQAKFDYYNTLLPHLLEEMRRLDIERIHFTRQAMLQSVRVETDVLSIIQRCYSDMNNAIGTIDPERDTLVLVEQNKTGFAHPLDFEFEDLGCPSAHASEDTASVDGSSTIKRPQGLKNINGRSLPRKHSLKIFNNSISSKSNGTSTGGSHSSTGSTGEYGNLPPQQRCRRIEKKLEELANELGIKEQSQAALEKMHAVYDNDKNMGDPQVVAKQIVQNRHEVEYIKEQIAKFKGLLLDAQSELNQPLGGGNNHLNTTTNSTIGSSPGSSPRGSAGSMAAANSASRLNGINGIGHYGERGSSYSEASSISSADGAGSSVHGGGGGGGVGTTAVGGPTTNGGGLLAAPCAPPAALNNSTQSKKPAPHSSSTSSPQTAIQQTSTTISSSGFSSTSPALTPVTSSAQLPHIDNPSPDFYEECDGPVGEGGGVREAQQSDLVLGNAIAIYAYDATPDEAGGTTITMSDGDDLLLLERDMGDGWTRVRHRRSNAEGFVPTSYLNCNWYATPPQKPAAH